MRDVAVVLSGGGVNGVLLELGFLQRLRATDLWPRVGWIFGTSSGALSGAMAAIDRLDDLEEFMLALQPAETFRPNRSGGCRFSASTTTRSRRRSRRGSAIRSRSRGGWRRARSRSSSSPPT